MLKDRLIEEKMLRQPVRAAYEIRSGGSSLKGEGEVSLFERSIIFSPLDGQMFRVKLGLISRMERAEHRLVLQHRHGSLELFKMGAELDPFAVLVDKALSALKEEAGRCSRRSIRTSAPPCSPRPPTCSWTGGRPAGRRSNHWTWASGRPWQKGSRPPG